MIINYNSNINPMPTNGGTGSNPAPPNANASRNSSGILLPLAAPVKQPIQIIGLVPLWPCCNSVSIGATCPFNLSLTRCPNNNATFSLIIGGTPYVIAWPYLLVENQTTGLLIVGIQYTINAYNAGDDFTNVGASSNASGVIFTATGTTPTNWTHASQLIQQPTVTYLAGIINTALAGTGITATLNLTSGSLTVAPGIPQTFAVVLTSAPGTSLNGVPVSANTSGSCVSFLSNQKTPVFSGGSNATIACSCDCREGLFTSDQLPDDREYTLPVFADLSCDDSYHNDVNSWLLSFPVNLDPIAHGFFQIKKLIGTTYTTVATIIDNTYGTPISNACGQICNLTLNSGTLIVGNYYTIVDYLGDDFTNVGASSNANGITFQATGTTPTTWTNGSVLSSSSPCTNVNYGGFILSWQAVLAAFGPGTYIFYVGGGTTTDLPSYCLSSSPFCLKAFDCYACDSTVKFEANYDGGNFGSVTTQGQSWSLCCSQAASAQSQQITSNPFPWLDSIRFFGEFGYETAEFERDFVKYATGIINKVRDEAIKKFMLKTEKLPMWLHERFYAYGLMADQLYVSDYNINNPNYNYKHFWVVADGNYTPQYTNWSRYSKIQDLAFKEGDQFVFRDRCC